MRAWQKLLIIISLSASTTLLAAKADRDADPLKLMHFRVGLNLGLQTSQNYSLTLGGSWNPEYALGNGLAAVGELGVAEYGDEIGGNFTAIAYGAAMAFAFTKDLRGELGAGAQFWVGGITHSNLFAINVNLVSALTQSGSMMHGIFFGYSLVFVPGQPTHILRAGVDI